MPPQDSFNERLKTIAEGLLSLEINTVICPHIEGEKMPQPEHALIDIANAYGAWLRDKHQTDVFTQGAPSQASADFYLKLRQAADALQRTGHDINLLERICKTSDQLLGIFMRLDPGRTLVLKRSHTDRPTQVELLPEELIVVRKAWELMLEEIAMQTIIQIDGDVVQRLLRRAPDGVDMTQVMKAHERAVDVSIGFWGELVQLVGGALKGLGEFLSGRRST
ncbi:MAG TPA: hypothetical protein VJN18_26880 [Polyangiaceae bacterium]|nr:hypothetical protein [Polyangiaceae bacterium]